VLKQERIITSEPASLILQYHAVEVLLYEICFLTAYEPTIPLQRTELLHACYTAASALFDIFFSIPVEIYFTLTVVNWGQLFQGLTAISKLCLFEAEAEDFDLAQMRKAADLSGLTAKILDRMERATDLFDAGGDSTIWALSARKLRALKAWYDARIVEESASQTQTLATPDGTFAEANEVSFETRFDFDDDFWQETNNGWGFWGIPNVNSGL